MVNKLHAILYINFKLSIGVKNNILCSYLYHCSVHNPTK